MVYHEKNRSQHLNSHQINIDLSQINNAFRLPQIISAEIFLFFQSSGDSCFALFYLELDLSSSYCLSQLLAS